MTAAPFQPDEEPQSNTFHLSESGYRLPPYVIDPGSDMDIDSEKEEEEASAGNIDKILTKIWRCFLCGMLRKSPNPKGALRASYCKLSKGARNQVKVSRFLLRTRLLPAYSKPKGNHLHGLPSLRDLASLLDQICRKK